MLKSARAELVAQGQGGADVVATVARLLEVASRGLGAMRIPGEPRFVRTARRSPDAAGALLPEGRSPRYSAMVALGASGLDDAAQRSLLGGATAAEVAAAAVADAMSAPDPGAVALAVWAAAETGAQVPTAALDRLRVIAQDPAPADTVVVAWTLTALLAARDLADLAGATDRTVRRLLFATGAHGVFPHVLPAQAQRRWRRHIGCFADQVYPIQALARYFAATGDPAALAAADRCAARICALQGPAGQWWWHYDVRTGGVVEGYPVYSVHQHAMAPMALLELYQAGGFDGRAAVASGLGWIARHPESAEPLVDERLGVIWRKVGRREPPKAVRKARAVLSSVHPRLRLRVLDVVFPPARIDVECRPYELGWLLYAWTAPETVIDHLGVGRGTASRG